MATTKEYMIQKGDNLTNIAKTHGVTVDQLVQANGIKNPNLIYAGSTLKIPTTATISTYTDLGGGSGGSSTGTGSTASNGKPTEPTSYSGIDLSKYDSGYQKSDDVINAELNKTNAENAVNNYGDFAYGNQATFDEIMNKILNREDFSYDLNGDALYQQYKDKYIQQGKMAMQDTMGQAAAMTGGYGNSYAASVGNQAYQASLENLNDIVPELYQMAYDKYAQEGQDLYNQYGMLSDDRNTQYGMWADKYNQLISDRDYYGNEANNAYAKDYGQWSDQRDFDTNQYWTETNFGYGKYRDSVTDWENDRAFEEAQRQYNEQMAFSKEQYKNSQNNNSVGKVNDEGNPLVKGDDPVDDPKTPTLSEDIINALKGAKTNKRKAELLAGYANQYGWSQEYVDELMKQYGSATPDLDQRTWTMVSDGGWNLFGVDKNAKVKDQYGNPYTLDELVDALVEEGYSKSEAKDYVIDLQRELGIDKKWNPFK